MNLRLLMTHVDKYPNFIFRWGFNSPALETISRWLAVRVVIRSQLHDKRTQNMKTK